MRDDNAKRVRWFPYAVIVLLLAVLAAGTAANLDRNPQPQLVAEGITGRAGPVALEAPDSSADLARPELIRDALLDLDALTLPDGATLAGWNGPWRFVWPRDASFVAAARCSVGQYAEADKVLGFLNTIRPSAGRWAARYSAPDGGEPQDGREPQLDGSGWVLWATWFCAETQSKPQSSTTLTKYWPMVKESGDQIVAELGEDDLPAASPDYWERPEAKVTLGTIAPLLTGLRAGLAIATELDRSTQVAHWRDALERLSAATDRKFGPSYPRTPAEAVSFVEPGVEPVALEGGADAIVTILGPPFAPAREIVTKAIERTRNVLTQPNGGVTPGEQWRADGVSWTPQTALFALSAAARGDRSTAEELLAWLDAHRTATGSLPEKVNRDLKPAGEAPLAWTTALVVLTASALDHPLPVP
ncbi:glucoamylase [Streptomyces sp. SID13031]|uniref:glucoamylase n=1 Tax=Streptomyces sp. SID13031 TaxID=2706046 RepID=UPI0013CB58D5|nr:glucoamylase [Streptomyces sp. SID13031]NEA36624.1 glucoamylase [Streptomyces sp. SID13031]